MATPARPGPPVPTAVLKPPAAPLLVAARTLSLVALVGLGFIAYLAGLSGLQQKRSQDTLYASFRSQLAKATAPVTAPITEGAAVAILEVPRLNIRQVVVEGTASGDLMRGPGHRRDTALPGQPGVSVITGRRAAFGGPFSRLDELIAGDEVGVVTGLGRATYTVTSVRPTDVPAPTGQQPTNRLSLVTSDPAWRATRGLIATARLVTAPLPGPSQVAAIRVDERSGNGETGALLPLVLWAQALLICAGLTAWAYARWGRWSAYLLTTPAVLAVLWNVYDNLARLLPNTL